MEQPLTTYIMYEIVCLDSNIGYNYVGSTKNFRARKCKHKNACNKETDINHHLNVYKYIRENGGWDNWVIRPLEEFKCETTIQSRIREQFWIDSKNAKLNMFKAYISEEQRKIQDQQYDLNNKDHIKARKQKYYIDNAEQLKQYYEDNKQHIKEIKAMRYQSNKAQFCEDAKQYRLNNPKQTSRKTCECGTNFYEYLESQHRKSKKHQKFINKV